MKLKGKTAIITGASRGIGRAIALEFAKEGCNILINYAGNEQAARETEEAIKAMHGSHPVKTYLCKADVSKAEEARSMVKQATEFFGKIDILVNNAGVASPALLQKMSDEQWHKVIRVDLHGVFNTTRAVINHMTDNKEGRIINMSSVFGQTGSFGQCNYSAAKWGVIGFTKSLALETVKHGILVNAIAPGAVDTDLARPWKEELEPQIPMKRVARPEEIAKTALFLAADATYVTGEVIAVNGGMHV